MIEERIASPRVALNRRAVANRVHPILPMLLEVRSRISRLDNVGESQRGEQGMSEMERIGG